MKSIIKLKTIPYQDFKIQDINLHFNKNLLNFFHKIGCYLPLIRNDENDFMDYEIITYAFDYSHKNP